MDGLHGRRRARRRQSRSMRPTAWVADRVCRRRAARSASSRSSPMCPATAGLGRAGDVGVHLTGERVGPRSSSWSSSNRAAPVHRLAPPANRRDLRVRATSKRGPASRTPARSSVKPPLENLARVAQPARRMEQGVDGETRGKLGGAMQGANRRRSRRELVGAHCVPGRGRAAGARFPECGALRLWPPRRDRAHCQTLPFERRGRRWAHDANSARTRRSGIDCRQLRAPCSRSSARRCTSSWPRARRAAACNLSSRLDVVG